MDLVLAMNNNLFDSDIISGSDVSTHFILLQAVARSNTLFPSNKHSFLSG